MINPWMIYLITRLDCILIALAIVATILIVFLAMCLLVAVDDSLLPDDEKIENAKKGAKITFLALIMCASLLVALPSTNTMAAIFIIPALAKSQTVEQLGEDIRSLVHDWLIEISPKKEVK